MGKPVKNDLQPSQSEAGFELSQKPQSGSAAEFKNPQTSDINLGGPRKRVPIPVHTKRQLFTQAQGCCQFITANGLRCGSQFQLQIDHITPVTWGGSSSQDNLRLLCRTYNLLMAQQMRLPQ